MEDLQIYSGGNQAEAVTTTLRKDRTRDQKGQRLNESVGRLSCIYKSRVNSVFGRYF